MPVFVISDFYAHVRLCIILFTRCGTVRLTNRYRLSLDLLYSAGYTFWTGQF